MSTRRFVPGGLLLAVLVGATPALPGETVELIQTSEDVPEASLMDIDVLAFDPGLSNEKTLRELKKAGIFPEVRKAEALYIPVHLARTLQKAGFWGAVRVGPAASIDDLTISGAIASSTGTELKVDVRVVDSHGTVWLDKRYKSKAASVYNVRDIVDDPFQELYNRIANDILARRRKVDQKDVTRIREVTLLRFAADLAPTAFANYLVSAKDRYSVARLPARNDPMMARIERLRLRDRMLIDTLDSYYADFYAQMREPYSSWRSQDYWRREAMSRSSGTRRSFWGGSGARGNGGGSSLVPFPAGRDTPSVGVGPVCATPQLFRGTRGSNDLEEPKESTWIDHLEVLRELGGSLASDMAPLLVEVEGKVLRLTGSADTVYARWRELLREIFATETGRPVLALPAASTTN